MVLFTLKALLGAQTLLSIASLSSAQQYVGATINTTLPAVPGSEITYFNIKDANSKNTSLINYMSLNSKSQRPDPKLLKRVVIVVHGLNRDPGTYTSNMLSALAQVTGRSDVNTDSVAVVAPYFTNGDDKGVGYPWDTAKGGSYTSVLVWKGSQWASGANNQYPKTQTTVSSYAVLDQLTQYFDNKTAFPNINQIVIAGHSLGAQTVQRYCEVGANLGTKTPVVYWVGNPNSFGWMSTDRPVDSSSCDTYDDWRDGLSSYTNTYGAALVASGRANVLANYNTKSIAYARGTLDTGDDSSGCAPGTTGAERNERFFNFIKAFPPTSSCTIDYVKMGHDGGGMFAAPAGQARLFLDNFDGSGSKAYDYGYPRLQAGDDPFPDPSQSSSVAAVNPGTFNGMTYQGCYADQTPSSLALKAYSSDSNTIDLCTQTCASKGYKIAGLEFGSECWCGNSMNYKARKTADQGCTMTCSGNSNQACGSGYRLSVFSAGNVTIDTKPVSPIQAGSFSLLGCYSEANSGGALSDKSTSQSGMTVENCAAYCSGYNYFGVEYGVECYCGNTVACSSVSSLATNCTMTCGGNATEYCGNGGYLNMYALPSNTGPSVCPSSTSTSSTATSSAVSISTTTTGSATITVSASSSTSATASSTALACPAADGTTYTTKNNKSYLIECYTDHYAGDMLTTSASTLELCIDACDANAGCVDVAWVYGSCYLKSSVGAKITNNAVLGAKLIASATSTSSSSSTTGSATSSPTTGSSASSSASSSSVSSSSASSSSSVSSSSTGSSSTSSTPTTSASAISCPASDGTTSVGSSGQSFLIECGIDHAGGDMGGPSYPGSFAACVAQCDSTTGCVDVSYVNNGPCYLKKSLGPSVTNTGIWGAKLVTSTSSSSTPTSSSVASSSSAVTSSSSSSAVSSSASSTSTPISSSSTTPASSSTPAASSSTTPASSSASSSTSSSTTATLPTGIVAKGCYVDGSTRAFPTQIYSNSSNTPSLCASVCREKGYKYAGTEYGSECWCGPSLPATADSTSDCSSSCSGDGTQKCGGSYRLTVTEDTTWLPTFFARASYGTWNLMSCYQDQVSNKRTLATSVAIDASTATMAKFLDACYAKGLTYCGAEYYHECYGSSTRPADSLVVPDISDPLLAGCNYPCSGNSTESCGGSNRVLVYVNNGTRMST